MNKTKKIYCPVCNSMYNSMMGGQWRRCKKCGAGFVGKMRYTPWPKKPVAWSEVSKTG